MPDKKIPTMVPVPKLLDTMISRSTITLGLPATTERVHVYTMH